MASSFKYLGFLDGELEMSSSTLHFFITYSKKFIIHLKSQIYCLCYLCVFISALLTLFRNNSDIATQNT